MNKTITRPTQAKLKEYHQELVQREIQERKDKFILLTLAIAGLVGVYVLVLNGVERSNMTDSSPVAIEHEVMDRGSRSASIN